MDAQMLDGILGGRPINTKFYKAFFSNMYAWRPDLILRLAAEHPSFRESRDVNGHAGVDLGPKDMIHTYNEERRGRRGNPDDGKHPIDAGRDIYLKTVCNNDMKKKNIIRVCNWLELSDEDAGRLIRISLPTDPVTVDLGSVLPVFTNMNIGRKLYRRFFERLYKNKPEQLLSISGRPFTDNPNGRNCRIDLGPKESLHSKWGRDAANPDTSLCPIDKERDLWLMTNNSNIMAKRKLSWVCRELNISAEEALSLLNDDNP